jgi:exopolysaccharide production protein ExoQ
VTQPVYDRPVAAPWPPLRQAPAAPAASSLTETIALSLAVMMILVFSQGWQFPLTGDAVNQDSMLLRLGILPAYAAAVMLLFMSPLSAVKATLRQPFLIALMGVVCASYFWSIAPDQTARRAFAVVCTTLGGVVMASRFRWSQIAEVTAIAFAVLAVLSLLVCLAVPRIGVMSEIFPGAWRGLWVEKNVLGGIMALGFSIFASAAILNPRRALVWCGFAVLALFLVLMSQSKTSLVSLLLGAMAMGFIWIVQRGPAIGVASVWLAVSACVLVGAFIFFASDVFFELLGKDATLTGRTEIWTAIIRQIEQRPWTGYGYQAVWSDKSGRGPFAWIVKEAGFTPQHAHNSWLEQWLGMGLLGLAAWGLFYLQTMMTAILAIFRHRGAYLVFPFLLMFSLITMTESIAVTFNDFRWTLFVAFAVKLAYPGPDRQTS